MGDVLHAMPAVAALRERHPDWFIGWAIEPGWSPLLQAPSASSPTSQQPLRDGRMPLVDRWYGVPTKHWKHQPFSSKTLSGIGALRQELRREDFDLCVDMQGAIRSAVVGRIAGAKLLAGPAEPRERPAELLYQLKAETSAAHVVEQGCEILAAAVGEILQPAKVTLPFDASDEHWLDALAGDQPFVFMAPTAGWGAKVWPAERYGAVAQELARAGLRTLVNASSPEDEAGQRVVQASAGAATLLPCSLGQMIALTRRASLVLAGDTGPLHLAAALERPVVGLYGPTDPARNGPYGTRAVVLRHESSKKDHARHAKTEAGLLQITVAEVVEAALPLLRGEQDKVKE